LPDTNRNNSQCIGRVHCRRKHQPDNENVEKEAEEKKKRVKDKRDKLKTVGKPLENAFAVLRT